MGSLAEEIKKLEQEILRHNKLYWELNAPAISDIEYDSLVKILRDLSPDSPVLKQVGHNVASSAKSTVHITPMLSLDKCYTDAELLKWAKKFRGEFVTSPKMDGIAASIHYDQTGLLVSASTRGDGVTGEDITANVRTIQDIPRGIFQGPLEVRGEIYMKRSVFKQFAGKFSNPRNLAAGAVKHKDPEKCAGYQLSFKAYDLLGLDFTSELDKLNYLRDIGFDIVNTLIVHPVDETPLVFLLAYAFRNFSDYRDRMDYEIDGVVFKANQTSEQKRVGVTSHHPKYAIAYKFQGDSAVTTLKSVEWSVSRNGTITPVAHLEPVELSGAKISQASLHHAKFLDKLGLLWLPAGARVEVTRRGGVIPKIERVVEQLYDGGDPIVIPAVCPSCGSRTIMQGDFLHCIYPETCPDAIAGRIAHYCKVVDIQGFGDKLIKQLVEADMVVTPVDLYTLTVEDLTSLDRIGERSANNLLYRIDSHRSMQLSIFLTALGIDELGKHVAQILQDEYKTIKDVMQVPSIELAEIPSIGQIIAEKVAYGLEENSDLIHDLLDYVEIIEQVETAPSPNSSLAGLSFVFTGKLVNFTRKEAQQSVQAQGGETPSSVTKNLHYLVVGSGKEDKKSSKLVKAEKLIEAGSPLTILTEDEFLSMIGV